MNNKKSYTLLYILLFIWILGASFTFGVLNFDYELQTYLLSSCSNNFEKFFFIFFGWPSLLGYFVVYFFH